MRTLGDAWGWYLATRDNLARMQRIGRLYWEKIPWDVHPMGRDDTFRMLEAGEVEQETAKSLAPIDDLAVMVLFTVFEAEVRAYLAARVRPDADRLTDPILREAANDAIRGVEEGSFYLRVLEPLKKQDPALADLVTQVNQVRDFRNWVAHGRRDRPKNNVDPKSAYDRLREFLDALGIATEAEAPIFEEGGATFG